MIKTKSNISDNNNKNKKKHSIINDIAKADTTDTVEKNITLINWNEIQDANAKRAAVAKAQLFGEAINVITTETNIIDKLSQQHNSSIEVVDLITPKHIMKKKQELV
jgi:hypothetical protein